MFARACFAAVALFWIAMNVLLWQAEFGPGRELGSRIPPEVVCDRILTAPDDSSLEIRREGRRIGYCRWVPTARGAPAGRRSGRVDSLPEGMVSDIAGYTVTLDGNVLLQEPSLHVKFNLQAQLAPDRTWRRFSLRVTAPPNAWQIQASATNETAVLRWEHGRDAWERTFTFAELRDPQTLLSEFEGPAALVLAGPLAAWMRSDTGSLTPAWRAQTDWLKVSGARARAYRVEAPLGARPGIVIVINRVGELMRVELPGGLSLVNDLLLNL